MPESATAWGTERKDIMSRVSRKSEDNPKRLSEATENQRAKIIGRRGYVSLEDFFKGCTRKMRKFRRWWWLR